MSTLPKGWEELSIGEVILPFKSIDPTKEPSKEFRYIDIGSIDNSRQVITDPKTFKGKDAPSRARRVVQDGDVLFSTVRTYLKYIATIPSELSGAMTSTGIAVLRPSTRVDCRYLFNWVTSDAFIAEISKSQDGTMHPAVSDRDVSSSRIAVPPVFEQRRIVAKLDSLTGRTVRARDELGRIPKLIQKYREAILAAAFSGELTREWRDVHNLTSLWKESEIAHICNVVTGSTPPTKEKHKYFGGPIPFFKPTDLDAGYSVIEPRETLTFEGAKRARLIPKRSTLVTCIGATIGKTGFARVDCATNQQINALVPDPNAVVSEWLYWMVCSPEFQAAMIDNSSATTLPIINKGRFERLSLCVPSTDEQREIVRRLETAFAWLDRVAAEHANASRLLPKLDQAILAKAFRVELVLSDGQPRTLADAES